MAGFLRRTGGALSADARKRLTALKPYPTLDMWRNPITRGFARRIQNEEWRKSVEEIDFEHRFTPANFGGVDGVGYEASARAHGAPFVLFVHGGGFVAGGPRESASVALPICNLSGADGFGPALSLLPEAAYPTQIEELSAVYHALSTDFPGTRIALVAESTGCAIALSALMRWRTEGAPLPACAIFLSPCVDGTGVSDSHIALDGRDPLIKSRNGAYARDLFRFYAPKQSLADPDVSPIFGDFHGLPPLLIQVGAREVLLGDAARLADAARAAGAAETLQVYDGMFHRFHAHWSLDEARRAHKAVAEFISTC